MNWIFFMHFYPTQIRWEIYEAMYFIQRNIIIITLGRAQEQFYCPKRIHLCLNAINDREKKCSSLIG